jgi:hypothetical protein
MTLATGAAGALDLVVESLAMAERLSSLEASR